jgi:hypothetical protein
MFTQRANIDLEWINRDFGVRSSEGHGIFMQLEKIKLER